MRGSRLLPRFLQSYVGNMIDGVRLLGGRSWGFIVTVGDRHVEAFKFSFVEGSPRPWGFSACCFSTKTIRQSQVARVWSRRSRVGDIVIFDVLGAASRARST